MSAKHTPGPWELDKQALGIWAPNAKGGETKIFDVRGWGYLTGGGHGALGLDHETAKSIQTANGRIAAAALDMLEALKLARAYLDVSLGSPSWTGDNPYTVIDAAIAKATGAA